MGSRWYRRSLTLAVLLTFFCSISRAEGQPVPAQPELPAIHVAMLPNDDITSVLYAVDKGLFRQAGLNVQLERAASGSAIAAAIAGGSYDIGKSAITEIFKGYQKGLPFAIIAPAGIYNSTKPYGGIVVSKPSGIRTASDLMGKVVAVISLHDIGQIAVDAWMTQHGEDPSRVKYVELPESAMTAAITDHRIDAAELVNPTLAVALATHNFTLFPVYDAIAPSFLFSVWFTTSTWADAHRAEVGTFARVVAAAAAYTNAHPAETAAILANYTALPVSVIESMPRMTNGTVVTASQIQPAIDASAKDGVLAHPFPAQDVMFK